MENPGLCRKIEEKISCCEKKYEQFKNDSFFSTVYASELETLRTLYERFQNSISAEDLRVDFQEKLAELEILKKQEEQHPSFDWYDEHYHYKVLDGQCDAYRSMIELLEEADHSATE